MENSIKEDIKIVENYLANSAINEIDSNFFKNSGWETVDLEIPKSMQHILSDYKRVLKENEQLSTEVNSLKKENEELKFKERSRIIGKYGDVEIHDVINRTLSNDYIPVQKVKDIIDRIDYDIKKTKEIISKNTNIYASYRKNDYQIVRLRAMNTKSLDIKKRLQELLEGREENESN